MISFCTKGLLRWGLISAAVIGGTTILVGPDRGRCGVRSGSLDGIPPL